MELNRFGIMRRNEGFQRTRFSLKIQAGRWFSFRQSSGSSDLDCCASLFYPFDGGGIFLSVETGNRRYWDGPLHTFFIGMNEHSYIVVRFEVKVRYFKNAYV